MKPIISSDRQSVKQQRRYKTFIEPKAVPKEQYQAFGRIDGSHSLKSAVPSMIVEYPVYRRMDGKVFYFNFALAKEMGLIANDHPEELNQQLDEAILDTFSLQIINEYDVLNHTPIPGNLIKPNRYMATRYLQLQHPNKRGTTSGDGRSIWNGEISAAGKTWDISSCGTGATQLSPATAQLGRFFKTGDPRVSYGNGRADLDDGIGAALMSEVFHRQGIPTERTLAIISYPHNHAVIVRAAPSLLRPAHFFSFLKRGQLTALTELANYYYDRQIKNSGWPAHKELKKRLDYMVEHIAKAFAYSAARFEDDYIFCWLEWDGDNILNNGGIIDYGSIRRLGLCHHAYRYDDGDRFSTSLFEQRQKARYIVQTFSQIRDYILTGTKKDIESFKDDTGVKLFNDRFRSTKTDLFLTRLGFSTKQKEIIFSKHKSSLKTLHNLFTMIERQLTLKEQHKTADGINQEAVFAAQRLLRDLPNALIQGNLQLLSSDDFINLMQTRFLKKVDRQYQIKLQTQRFQEFQKEYFNLAKKVSDACGTSLRRTLLEMGMRANLKAGPTPITGNAAIAVSETIMKKRRTLSADDVYAILKDVVRGAGDSKNKAIGKVLKVCFKTIVEYGEEI